jgi:hypothetical protein
MNSNSSSLLWAPYNSSYNGVRPPKPSVLSINEKQNITKKGTIAYIYSKREPYAVEHMYNGYGTLSSVLGTNLGTKFE